MIKNCLLVFGRCLILGFLILSLCKYWVSWEDAQLGYLFVTKYRLNDPD